MKFFSCLILFSIFGALYASDCCPNTCRRKIKVKDDFNPEIKVVYTGTPCACQKPLPFRVEKPIIPKEKLNKHKYNVHVKEEKSVPVCRYIYNTKVEKPVVEKVELSKYPVRVEKLLEECKNDPRFIYSVKIERPEEKCGTQLDGLVAKVDKIVLPMEDCLQPCCVPEKSCEETPRNKIKKCGKNTSNKYIQYPESSEEKVVESSEEIYPRKQYKKVSSKVSKCPKCESIVSEEQECGCKVKYQSSEEEGCGCKTKHQSSEEVYGCNKKDSSSEESSSCSSSEEEKPCHVEVEKSEESCEYKLPSEEHKEDCSREVKTSCDESSQEHSEETPKKCHEYSSEEHYSSEEIPCKKQKKPKVPTCSSSEESPEIIVEPCQCRRKYESSEESPETYVEPCHRCKNKQYESSEEIQTESSEEYLPCPEVKPKKIKYLPKKKKCESSEEYPAESSEETKNCGYNIPEEISEEEHWCKEKPMKIYSKHLRYSSSGESSKRFSRYKREFFLDDLQDLSVYTEPLTRNEIQKTIAKIRANSTIASANKRKRKGKRRQRNRDLVQNKDQFEEHNKLKQIFEAKTIDAVEEKTKDGQDDEDIIVNGKPNKSVLESYPKQLVQKLEDEVLLKQNEERDKRHSQCRTIEHLKKHPKYRMDILADAGCSQYIPEIISDDLAHGSSKLDPKIKYYDYLLANRNKRHLSTFDGNINYPIKFVDATKKTSSHPFHLKKVHYRRHHHPKHPHKPENLQSHDNFAVDPKFYYKYLSLTAPDLFTNDKTKTSEQDDLQSSSIPKEKKIVYDHLGHKFLEYNGFRTLIKPKFEYFDDTSYEKPKFWTCKEDLIDPKDFGKVTTVSEDVETVTEPLVNLVTTTGINLETQEPNLGTEELNLGTEESNLGLEEPNLGGKESNLKTEVPNLETEEPNLKTEEPNITEATLTTTEKILTPEYLHQIEDLEEHEFNLCEYLKNLEQTQNFEVQQEAKNIFLHNCESYIKFLIFNPSNEDRSSNITDSISKYLENLLHNSHLKHHIKNLLHTKHKFENNLANITKLLHKPKVVENFKNYLLFQNEFDSMKNKLKLKDYTINRFYIDLEFVLNEKFSTTTEKLSTNN